MSILLKVLVSPIFNFYTPWKRQKTKGFLKFYGEIEIEQCAKMG